MANTGIGLPRAIEVRRRNPLTDFLTRMVRTKPLGTASAVFVLLIILITDLSYAWLDPRIRYG